MCLKHYQAKIDTSSPCTFGDVSTRVLGDNNVDLQQNNNYNSPYNTNNNSINPIQFRFDFTWPVSTITFDIIKTSFYYVAHVYIKKLYVPKIYLMAQTLNNNIFFSK